ncbi:MAG: cation transporter [Euryarchaeota archaeon]|nr:cation transporter [Euryarchaeota archaeon]
MSQTLAVSGMSCTGCESNVEAAVSELPGCTDVEADHEDGTVTVEGDVDEGALQEAIEDSGYSVEA